MGVAGSGKTTVGRLLAERKDWTYLDADDLHPQSNVDKMASGVALTDEDRFPWLETVRDRLDAVLVAEGSAVLACSALKRRYRDVLRKASGRVTFVHLDARRDELVDRLAGRSAHFFPAALLDSQFAALEPPGGDEPAVAVSVAQPPEVVVDTVCALLTT